nr:MAG TPA: hypothetical protein [Caudoviricetes sp.]
MTHSLISAIIKTVKESTLHSPTRNREESEQK